MTGFKINPLWYLTTIPIGISLIGAGFVGLYGDNQMILILIFYIILLCGLVFLYINGIIGLLDMIFLFIIIFCYLNPITATSMMFLPILLIPLIMAISYSTQK